MHRCIQIMNSPWSSEPSWSVSAISQISFIICINTSIRMRNQEVGLHIMNLFIICMNTSISMRNQEVGLHIMNLFDHLHEHQHENSGSNTAKISMSESLVGVIYHESVYQLQTPGRCTLHRHHEGNNKVSHRRSRTVERSIRVQTAVRTLKGQMKVR